MKSIVITGASSGIGRATALRLARNGWRVFATVREEADAQAIKGEVNGALETVLLDIQDRRSITNAAHEVTVRLAGRGLDGLFNNAGIGGVSPVEYTPLATLREVYEINLFGQIAVIQAFLPLLRMARGRIINSGSIGDYLTPPCCGLISSSKAAFASMSAALRMELRPQGIHVCVIEPGSINTPAVKKTLTGVDKTIAALPPEGTMLYGDAMRQMARTFAKNEHHGSPADAVAKVVERALTERDPRTRYPAGKDSVSLKMLAKLLPEKLLDLALLKAFGVPTTFSRSVC